MGACSALILLVNVSFCSAESLLTCSHGLLLLPFGTSLLYLFSGWGLPWHASLILVSSLPFLFSLIVLGFAQLKGYDLSFLKKPWVIGAMIALMLTVLYVVGLYICDATTTDLYRCIGLALLGSYVIFLIEVLGIKDTNFVVYFLLFAVNISIGAIMGLLVSLMYCRRK